MLSRLSGNLAENFKYIWALIVFISGLAFMEIKLSLDYSVTLVIQSRLAADDHTQYIGKCSSLNLRFGLEDRDDSFSLQVQGIYQVNDPTRCTDPTN